LCIFYACFIYYNRGMIDAAANRDLRIENSSVELKNLLSEFESRSFLVQIAYLSNRHVRHRTGYVKLRSPIRQLTYLTSLFLSTEQNDARVFDPTGPDNDKIIRLLNDIDSHYREREANSDAVKEFIVASTFFNFYSNAPLTYVEQDIERIERTFQHQDVFIKSKTGLEIKDFIEFFKLITETEKQNYQKHVDYNLTQHDIDVISKSISNPKALTPFEKLRIDFFDNRINEVLISKAKLYETMPAEKVNKMLELFTLQRAADPAYIYYNDISPYLHKPILQPDWDHIAFVFSKQLINAMYEYLFKLCSADTLSERRMLEKRDKYLEQKTLEVLTDFFGSKAKIYTNYKVNGNEKDILVIEGERAYIVECKANRQRPPLRDINRAWERIRNDFNKCITKGFNQANEVFKLFERAEHFLLKNKNGKEVSIDAANIKDVFIIVVTQERFGQIQCDLDYLLEMGEDDVYPYSVYIDDLETFLITLKRRKEHLSEFRDFLYHREDLHGRLYCYDEMEMFAYFIFDRDNFLKYCNSDLDIHSSPDINLIFDELYKVGLGLKNEIGLPDKLNTRSVEAEAFISKNKLALPERVLTFKKSIAEV